jgi:hypothetical protein
MCVYAHVSFAYVCACVCVCVSVCGRVVEELCLGHACVCGGVGEGAHDRSHICVWYEMISTVRVCMCVCMCACI